MKRLYAKLTRSIITKEGVVILNNTPVIVLTLDANGLVSVIVESYIFHADFNEDNHLKTNNVGSDLIIEVNPEYLTFTCLG